MKKTVRILSGVLFICALVFAIKTELAFAYTISDIGDYIENPEWFDNQEGKYATNYSNHVIVKGDEPIVNSRIIYFNKNNKVYQLYVRQYDETKGIDIDNDDLTWSVIDERICTVDQNGKVTAGNMTGATTIRAEYDDYILRFVVVNQTGKYDEWYEEMFTDMFIHTVDAYGFFKVENHMGMAGARISESSLGKAYKVITDAYLQYGYSLYNDPDVRLKVVKEAVFEAVGVVDGVKPEKAMDIADCQYVANYSSMVSSVFCDGNRTQKYAESSVTVPGHATNVILLDGVVYNANGSVFTKLGVESDGKWISDNKFEFKGMYGKDEFTARLETEKGGNMSSDKEGMMKKLNKLKVK